VAVWSYFWKRLLGVSTLGPTAIVTDRASCAETESTGQYADSNISGRG